MGPPRVFVALALVFVAFVAACPGPAPEFTNPGGSGGVNTLPASSSSFTSSSTATSSTATSSTGVGGGAASSTAASSTGVGGSADAGTGANGASCETTTECLSGYCVNGVCCATACTDTCQACTNALTAQEPDGTCGNVQQGVFAPGQCAGSCIGGFVTSQAACNGQGGCLQAESMSCAPYAGCNGPVCATSCTTASDCAGGMVCTAGACVPALVNSTACTSATACASGFCADGVCCNEACTGTCQACTAAEQGGGADGTCGPVAIGTDPNKQCAGLACNGQGACLTGKRVFVTDEEFVGSYFGNAMGADAQCQATAEAQLLGGQWDAWMSDATTSPAQRFTQSTAPYELLDGTMVANDWADLTSEALLEDIDLDETGTPVTTGFVWTGTLSTGLASTNNCASWTNGTQDVGDFGATTQTGSGWSMEDSTLCSTEAHVYCFEQ
jgi:hypothetical protein